MNLRVNVQSPPRSYIKSKWRDLWIGVLMTYITYIHRHGSATTASLLGEQFKRPFYKHGKHAPSSRRAASPVGGMFSMFLKNTFPRPMQAGHIKRDLKLWATRWLPMVHISKHAGVRLAGHGLTGEWTGNHRSLVSPQALLTKSKHNNEGPNLVCTSSAASFGQSRTVFPRNTALTLYIIIFYSHTGCNKRRTVKKSRTAFLRLYHSSTA